MLCPNCSHVFHIKNGIPNMVSGRVDTLFKLSCPSLTLYLHSLSSSWPSTRSQSECVRVVALALFSHTVPRRALPLYASPAHLACTLYQALSICFPSCFSVCVVLLR